MPSGRYVVLEVGGDTRRLYDGDEVTLCLPLEGGIKVTVPLKVVGAGDDSKPQSLLNEMAERIGPTTAMEIAHLIRTRAAGLTPPVLDGYNPQECWNRGVTDVLEMLR